MDDDEFDEGPSGTLMKIVLAVGIPIAFVICVVDRAWFAAGIIALAGVVLGLFYAWTSKLVRGAQELSDELPAAPAGPPSEAALAIGAWYDAIGDARGIPLTDQVRLDRRKVNVLLDRLRAVQPAGAFELDQLIQQAKPIPLTDEIRLERDDVYDVLDRMSASVAGAR